MKELRTIILAAGRGTRMQSQVPKVLHAVCGQAIIDYVIEVARKLGSLKIYAVLGFKSDEVKSYLPETIQTVVQKKLLGTADAIRSCAPHFKNYRRDVLILSGDTPLLDSKIVGQVVKTHRHSKAALTFLTAIVPQPSGYGRIIRNYQGQVTAIREEKDAHNAEKAIQEINVGVYCFDGPTLFRSINKIKLNPRKKEFYLTDIVDLLIAEGLKVETVLTPDYQQGLGVNTRDDLALCEEIIRKRILRRFMLQGITIVDPLTTFIAADAKIGQDTVIRPFTFIENNVTIGSNCLLGPFCRIRPGSYIDDGVEIGNFTEISRTRMGKNSLMKHFSFLGDARLGERVNIGAGTVTANYDGKNKNITTIADDAFIGSDSVLIAPVKVGKKAVTGAGTVLTKGKNVPDGEMAVGVPARVMARRKNK